MKEIDDAFGHWFAGFTDGEGCFYIRKNNRWSPCADYQCGFSIGLRNDDRPILEEIHNKLEIGTISEKPPTAHSTTNAHPQTIFLVCDIKQCDTLTKLFVTYPLRAKKQNDFNIWKRAVTELMKPIEYRNADLLEYYYLKIREVRMYKKQINITKPQIKELQLTLKFQ